MRRYLLPLLLLSVLLASPALAQKKGGGLQSFNAQPARDESEADLVAARRKAAGIQDLKAFGANREVPPQPIPWRGIGLAVAVMLLAAPFGWKMYKSTRKDLEDQSTFGTGKARREVAAAEGGEAPRISKRPPARALKAANVNATRALTAEELGLEAQAQEEEAEGGARDLVWDAVSSSGGSWVTTDWVANKAGLSAAEAGEEIGALVEEGYLQEARDNKGKPVFRPA